MAETKHWLEIYNEYYEEYGILRGEDGDECWPERSVLSGPFALDNKVVEVSIQRDERTLDPWHVEILNDTHVHCLVERFWDDKEAWEAARSRLFEVGLERL